MSPFSQSSPKLIARRAMAGRETSTRCDRRLSKKISASANLSILTGTSTEAACEFACDNIVNLATCCPARRNLSV